MGKNTDYNSQRKITKTKFQKHVKMKHKTKAVRNCRWCMSLPLGFFAAPSFSCACVLNQKSHHYSKRSVSFVPSPLSHVFESFMNKFYFLLPVRDCQFCLLPGTRVSQVTKLSPLRIFPRNNTINGNRDNSKKKYFWSITCILVTTKNTSKLNIFFKFLRKKKESDPHCMNTKMFWANFKTIELNMWPLEC